MVTVPTAAASTAASPPQPVDLLILGHGWCGNFLASLLPTLNITFASTTTSGRDGTIPFTFNPSSHSPHPYTHLPIARTVLITFPLRGSGPSNLLTSLYAATHPDVDARWIQLGSTGIFNQMPGWNDSSSPYDRGNDRAVAEDELLALLRKKACVLSLAGLYDGVTRDPRNWVSRVAKTKEDLRKKGAVHFIHGQDVARAVAAAHVNFHAAGGTRWIVADLHTYDWWELAMRWADGGQGEGGGGLVDDTPDYRRWVTELMVEEDVRALPRDTNRLGRVLDSTGFWIQVGQRPEMAVPGGKYEAKGKRVEEL
jgi:hypothetical protein